jgi:hypothetical protein
VIQSVVLTRKDAKSEEVLAELRASGSTANELHGQNGRILALVYVQPNATTWIIQIIGLCTEREKPFISVQLCCKIWQLQHGPFTQNIEPTPTFKDDVLTVSLANVCIK